MQSRLVGLVAGLIFGLGSPAIAQTTIDRTDYGPTVRVQIGDEAAQDFQVLLDTGAAISVFDASQADDLDLTLLQDVNVGSNTGTRTRAGIYRAGPLGLDAFRTDDVQMLVLDLSSQGGPFIDGISGVLSPNIFASSVVEIDFARNVLTLRTLDDRPEGEPFAYDEARLPTARIQIAGTSYDAQIDSGASVFMSLPADLAQSLPLVSQPAVSGHISTVNDTVAVATAPLDGTVEIGGLEFESPELEFVAGSESILLGMAALEHFVITLAPASGEVWLTPAAQ